MRKYAILFIMLPLLPIFLIGCVGDQNGQITQNQKKDIADIAHEVLKELPTPVINVPPNQQVDLSEIKREIHVSADQTANQMTGAVNTNINRLADKINGVEANISKLADINIKLEANMTNMVSVSNDMKADLKVVAEVRLQLENNIKVVNDLKADLKVLTDIKAELVANANATASALVGIGNKVDTVNENIRASAGRDVNMLPRTAVDLVINVCLVVFAILFVIMLLSSLVICLFFKNAKESEILRTKEEESEKKRIYGLLMRALAIMPEKQGMSIARELENPLLQPLKGESLEDQKPTA